MAAPILPTDNENDYGFTDAYVIENIKKQREEALQSLERKERLQEIEDYKTDREERRRNDVLEAKRFRVTVTLSVVVIVISTISLIVSIISLFRS